MLSSLLPAARIVLSGDQASVLTRPPFPTNSRSCSSVALLLSRMALSMTIASVAPSGENSTGPKTGLLIARVSVICGLFWIVIARVPSCGDGGWRRRSSWHNGQISWRGSWGCGWATGTDQPVERRAGQQYQRRHGQILSATSVSAITNATKQPVLRPRDGACAGTDAV